MKRMILMIAVFGLLAAACSGTTVDPGDASDTSSSSVSSGDSTDTSSASSSSTNAPISESSTTVATAKPEGPGAPDFTLALQPTGEFFLSQEVKPVYMVFWAEW